MIAIFKKKKKKNSRTLYCSTFKTGAVEIWFLPDFLVSNNYTIQDAALVLTLSGFANVSGRLIAGIFESCFRYLLRFKFEI